MTTAQPASPAGIFTGSATPIPRYGLYYPYVHMRDEAWLKLAVMYEPKMARVVVSGFPIRDSEAAKAVAAELDWIIDLAPGSARERVALGFQLLIDDLQGHANWAAANLGRDRPASLDVPPIWGSIRSSMSWRSGTLSNSTGVMPAAEFASELVDRMIETGIAARIDADPEHDRAELDGGWLAIQRDVAWTYKCMLSEELAINHRLTLITDQAQAYAVASGISAQQAVLGGIAGQLDQVDLGSFGAQRRSDELSDDAYTNAMAARFSLLCIKAAIPSNLDAVPMSKIIELRRRHGEEFDRWRISIDHLAAEVATELAAIESPHVLQTYLTDAVNRYSVNGLKPIRSSMSSLGIDAALGLMDIKVQVPSILAAVGAQEHSAVALAAGAAMGVVQLYRTTREKRRANLVSPAAYLWQINNELDMASRLSRFGRMMKVSTGHLRP